MDHRPARVHRSYHWRSALSRANTDDYIFVSGQVGFVDAKGKEVFNLARFFMSTMKDFAFHTIYNYSARMRFGCTLNLGDLIRKKKTVAQLEH